MLDHEQTEHSPGRFGQAADSARSGTSDAESVRVSADEFNAALRAIEQRRANAAQHHAGTVDVGQTIRELGIDATPEEILAEIEAERARSAAQDRAKSDAKAKAQKAASDVWDYASSAYETIRQRIDEAAADSGSRSRHGRIAINVNIGSKRDRRRHRGGIGGLIGAAAIFWIFWSLMSGHLFSIFPRVLRTVGVSLTGSPGVVMTLATAPAGKTVYCNTDSLLKIIGAGGRIAASDGTVEVTSSQLDNTWPVTIHDGVAYLHGFMLPSEAEQLTSGSVDILNDGDSGELDDKSAVAVTIPLKDVRLDGYAVHGDWSQVAVSNIAPDSLTRVSQE